jgi:hypothetical protein
MRTSYFSLDLATISTNKSRFPSTWMMTMTMSQFSLQRTNPADRNHDLLQVHKIRLVTDHDSSESTRTIAGKGRWSWRQRRCQERCLRARTIAIHVESLGPEVPHVNSLLSVCLAREPKHILSQKHPQIHPTLKHSETPPHLTCH